MTTRTTRSSALAAQKELDGLPASTADERDSKVRRSVTARVLVDSDRGVDLNVWLSSNTPKLDNSRIFYVIQARSDVARGVFKFGFSNLTSASRLRSYVHMYGPGDVKLHILIRTAYNLNVTRESSHVYRLELRIKRKLRPEIERLGRGDERVDVSLSTLRRLLFLEAADEAHKIVQALDVVTLVDLNRSRRLRALNVLLPALPFGVGRG